MKRPFLRLSWAVLASCLAASCANSELAVVEAGGPGEEQTSEHGIREPEMGYPSVGELVAHSPDLGESLHWCAAVLIAPNRVATSAHCAVNSRWDLARFATGHEPGFLRFSLGGQTRWVVSSAIEPRFYASGYDIAVLTLDSPITDVAPAQLAQAVPTAACEAQYQAVVAVREYRYSGSFCVSGLLPHGVLKAQGVTGMLCSGDGGAALFLAGTNQLVGIASRGVCAQRAETHFSAVDSHRAFLESSVGGELSCAAVSALARASGVSAMLTDACAGSPTPSGCAACIERLASHDPSAVGDPCRTNTTLQACDATSGCAWYACADTPGAIACRQAGTPLELACPPAVCHGACGRCDLVGEESACESSPFCRWDARGGGLALCVNEGTQSQVRHERPLRTLIAGSVASSEYSAAFRSGLAFDGVVSSTSKWTSGGQDPLPKLSVFLRRPMEVTRVVLHNAQAGGEEAQYAPKRYTIYSSLDAAESRLEVTNATQLDRVETRFASPTLRDVLRFEFLEKGMDQYVRIPEIQLFGREPAPIRTCTGASCCGPFKSCATGQACSWTGHCVTETTGSASFAVTFVTDRFAEVTVSHPDGLAYVELKAENALYGEPTEWLGHRFEGGKHHWTWRVLMTRRGTHKLRFTAAPNGQVYGVKYLSVP